MRLNGVEPSRPVKGTIPSSLRVYQFRHSRSGRAILDVRRGRGAWGGRRRAGARAGLRTSAGRGTLRTGVRTIAHAFGADEEDRLVDLDLTKRQKEIFDFIRRYADKTGYPPTVREIGKAVGLHSSSTVHAHLANLEKIGLLRRDPTKPRAGSSSSPCRRAARSPAVSRDRGAAGRSSRGWRGGRARSRRNAGRRLCRSRARSAGSRFCRHSGG